MKRRPEKNKRNYNFIQVIKNSVSLNYYIKLFYMGFFKKNVIFIRNTLVYASTNAVLKQLGCCVICPKKIKNKKPSQNKTKQETEKNMQ